MLGARPLYPIPYTLARRRRFETWNAKETEFLNETQLITAKPVVYLINLSEKNYCSKKGKWLKPVYEWIQVRAPVYQTLNPSRADRGSGWSTPGGRKPSVPAGWVYGWLQMCLVPCPLCFAVGEAIGLGLS